jgi:hypothetical protein
MMTTKQSKTTQFYFPKEVMKNILDFCDDRLENNQKINLSKCLAVIVHLRLIADFWNLDTQRTDLIDGFIPNMYETDVMGIELGNVRDMDINFNEEETQPLTTLYESWRVQFMNCNHNEYMIEAWDNEVVFTNSF